MLSHVTPFHSGLNCTCFPWQKKLQEAEKQIQQLSEWVYLDSLTGLYNFRYFKQRLKKEFGQARKQKTSLAALMMDLDDFGKLNKEFNHMEVNKALQQVAAALQKCVRPSDGLIRFGGDEFLALLPQTGMDAATQTAKRIQEQINTLKPPFPAEIRLSMTIGIAVYPDCAWTAGKLVEAADLALLNGKRLGKNRIELSPSLR